MKILKAQFVYENMDFERGKDPKDTLQIGRWMERKIKDVMEEFVQKYGGSYEIERTDQGVNGFYGNEMFSSGGRSIHYDFHTKNLSFSFPDWGRSQTIPSLDYFRYNVIDDLETKMKEGGVPEQQW